MDAITIMRKALSLDADLKRYHSEIVSSEFQMDIRNHFLKVFGHIGRYMLDKYDNADDLLCKLSEEQLNDFLEEYEI